MITHGRDLILTANGYPIGLAKSCDIDLTHQFISSCSPVSGMYKNKIISGAEWSVSCDGLVSINNSSSPTYAEQKQDTDNLMSIFLNHSKVHICFYDLNQAVHLCGEAFISSLKISGQVGSLSTYSVSFECSGAPTQLTPLTLTEVQPATGHGPGRKMVYQTGFVPSGSTLAGAYYFTSSNNASDKLYRVDIPQQTGTFVIHVIGNGICQLFKGEDEEEFEVTYASKYGEEYDDQANYDMEDLILKYSGNKYVYFRQSNTSAGNILVLNKPATVFLEPING